MTGRSTPSQIRFNWISKPNVRYGSDADIQLGKQNVRFVPQADIPIRRSATSGMGSSGC